MALICVGLMYSTNAGLPLIVTERPSSAIGRLLPENFDEVQEREELVKPVPTMETKPPDGRARQTVKEGWAARRRSLGRKGQAG